MNILVAIIPIILAAILTVQANIFTKNVHNSNPPTLVDVMRQRYFSIEDALWHVISSGMEQSYVLQQIHSGHRTFLRDNFAEKNCYFSTFDPDQQVLFDAIKEINLLATNTVQNYLHSSRSLFRESDSLAISARNLNLTDKLDKLFEITGTSDFYMTIRNVSIKIRIHYSFHSFRSFCFRSLPPSLCHHLLNSFRKSCLLHTIYILLIISDVLIAQKSNNKTEKLRGNTQKYGNRKLNDAIVYRDVSIHFICLIVFLLLLLLLMLLLLIVMPNGPYYSEFRKFHSWSETSKA